MPVTASVCAVAAGKESCRIYRQELSVFCRTGAGNHRNSHMKVGSPWALLAQNGYCNLLISLEFQELSPVEGMQKVRQHSDFQDIFCSLHQFFQSHHIYCFPFFIFRILNAFSRENEKKSLSSIFFLVQGCVVIGQGVVALN